MQDRIKVCIGVGRESPTKVGKEDDDTVAKFLYRPSGGTISQDNSAAPGGRETPLTGLPIVVAYSQTGKLY